jgi:hypothetical protein
MMATMNSRTNMALAALAVATGPAPVGAVMPVTPQTYAGIGRTVIVGPYAVTPRAVIEDSRCPPVVTCVWSGQVRLSVRVVALHGRERYIGQMTSMHPLQLQRGSLQLATITPPNAANGGHIPPRTYRFGFRYTSR